MSKPKIKNTGPLYDAPVTLAFVFLCLLIFVIDLFVDGALCNNFFSVYWNGRANPLACFRMFSHVLGHTSYSELTINSVMVLLLGPGLEEKYGSEALLAAILVIAFATGLFWICFGSYARMGADVIVLMMIVLALFADTNPERIPFTFLAAALYLAPEIVQPILEAGGPSPSNFLQYMGAVCGLLMGLLLPKKEDTVSALSEPLQKKPSEDLTVYNAPVTLTFVLLCGSILIIDSLVGGFLGQNFFSVYRCSLADPLAWFRMFGHSMGHVGWLHFRSNAILLLLLGPGLEGKYGGKKLVSAMLVTAFATGLFCFIYFPAFPERGASDIVFLMLVLTVFANSGPKRTPLPFALAAAIKLAYEVRTAIFQPETVTYAVHILGAVCGLLMGFLFRGRKAFLFSASPYHAKRKRHSA